MKILSNIIPEAYKISKDINEGKVTLKNGIETLIKKYPININSAKDYVYNFRYLLNGRRFTRTLNSESMEYFIDNIYRDYGIELLKNALAALKKHYLYYEGINKTRMHNMRKIYHKYILKISEANVVKNLEQLKKNLHVFENYLIDGSDFERGKISEYIKRGICFVAYEVNDEIRYAPSRFIGYIDNDLERHIPSESHGGDTNAAINSILKSKPRFDKDLEELYLQYCNKLGISYKTNTGSFGQKRKYWRLKLNKNFDKGESEKMFSEGDTVQRIHKARERNNTVIKLAKKRFKKKNGKLFCQICEFDFENKYGVIGKDFIEGHHTIAVCDMPPGHKTKPEDIAMLCSNCHRMVHKKRPWLTMKDLKSLLASKLL